MSQGIPGSEIPNYRRFAIVTVMLFFFPTGLVALRHSREVTRLIEEGKLDEARALSQHVRKLCWISVLLGILVYALTILGLIKLYYYVNSLVPQ